MVNVEFSMGREETDLVGSVGRKREGEE